MEVELSSLPPLPDSPVATMSMTSHRSPVRADRIPVSPYKAMLSPAKTRPDPAPAALASPPKIVYPTSPAKDRARLPSVSSPRKPISISPCKVALPPSPVRPAFTPSQLDASFMMPANLSDSLIGDTSMPTMMMDDSFDFDMPVCLQKKPVQTPHERGRLESPAKPRDRECERPTPTTPRMARTPSARTPAPPAPATAGPSASPRKSPLKTPSAVVRNTATAPVTVAPRTAPRTVVSRAVDMGDVSTLFPVSPARTAHLLGDEHQLLRESLPGASDEGQSFFLPPPPASTRKTPRKPNKADMTLDINELIAGMAKPKRPSGTEESFEDLLNAPGFDLDQSILGGEPFLPPDLRSRPRPQTNLSPAKHTPARLRNAGAMSSPGKMEPPRSAMRATPAAPSPRRPMDSPIRRIPGVPRTPAVPSAAASPSRPAPTPARAPASVRKLPSSSGISAPVPASSSSASVSRLALPAAGPVRNGLTSRASVAPASARPTSLVRTASTKTAESRVPAAGTARATASPVKPASAVPRAGHSRSGSTTLPPAATRTAAATAARAPTSRPGSFRPTSNLPPAKSSLPPSSTRTALPQPGTGPSARSAITRPTGSTTTTSRVFGTDGAATSNRLSARPAPTSRPAQTGKLSMAPPASPAKRETATSLKSRAASTPVTTVARTLPRPATATTTVKSSIPPPSTAASRATTAPRSALPRPPTSRLPAPGTATGKMSSGAARTAELLALRARINALSANQGTARRA